MRVLLSLILLAAGAAALQGQQADRNPDPAIRAWNAMWVTRPDSPLREPIVLHFRRMLKLGEKPDRYIVRVSADPRFLLYVNGKRVGDGPARGDIVHWRYERFDLAPYLRAGENWIAAVVWNAGVWAPVAQISDRTAFLLESEAKGESGISTPDGWTVMGDAGHIVVPREGSKVTLDYYAAGQSETLVGDATDWTWNDEKPASTGWAPVAPALPESLSSGNSRAHSAEVTADNNWGLVPDLLPHMTYEETSPGEVVRLDNIAAEQPSLSALPKGPAGLPPHVHVHILLDRKTLTTAYPELTVSGGKGAEIKLTYSEALYDKDMHKGDRDEIGDRQALGVSDLFFPDGGAQRTFEPFWWRTWRYLDLDITTEAEPLTLESLKAWFTAYPFEERAKLMTPDPDLAKIWEISWRTARLDAHETYMDTPYWEQLQYIGDTRIQALISYTVANDDRLGRQAIDAFDKSRIPEGLTRSRYPSYIPQTIPTFSLLYIGMLHDWWMYRPDAEFVRSMLPGERSVLGWFARYEQPDGLLKKVPWWTFVDWLNKGEIPTYDAKGESCIVTLHYLGAIQEAAELEQALGDTGLAAEDRDHAGRVSAAIYSKCWSGEKGLIADNPDKKIFSQQSNALAVLYDVIPKGDQQAVMTKILPVEPSASPESDGSSSDLLVASYYFRFYLSRALDHAGMADHYLAEGIDPWRKLLPLHFSTWPEQPGNTRSDSHAWTSHPIYDELTLVAGIEPASPGFKTVRIAPHLGNLPSLSASFPHPEGNIEVRYKQTAAGLDAAITLPAQLTGEFVYHGGTQPLHPGSNHIVAQ